MAKLTTTPAQLNVGDWVAYPMYPGPMPALVIELRGPLAPGGEYVYRLRSIYEWGEVREFEARESILEPCDPPTKLPQPRPESEWGQWTG